jgi:hypothetical protein
MCLKCSKHLVEGPVVCVGSSRFAGKCTACQDKKKPCEEVPEDLRGEVEVISAAWGDENITQDVREQLVVRARQYVVDVEAYFRRERAARERSAAPAAATPASAPMEQLIDVLRGIQYELHALRRQVEYGFDAVAFSDLEDE